MRIEDFNKLMITIGFKSKFITNVKLGIRNTYSLKFYGDNFIFYGKFIGLVHPEKMDTLTFQINRHFKLRVFKKGETKNKLFKILNNESLTSLELAKRLDISQNWVGAYLRGLIKEGLIEKYRIPGKNKIAYKLISN